MAGERVEPWIATPASGYFLSALLAIGIHVGLLLGWQRAPFFQPAEYEVVSGESAVEVTLIAESAVLDDLPVIEEEPVEAKEQAETRKPVEVDEPTAEVIKEPELESVPALPQESVETSMVQATPVVENPAEAKPSPNSRPPVRLSPSRPAPAKRRPSVGRSSEGNPALSTKAAFGSTSSKPAYLFNPHPSYPEAARKAGHTGVAVLRVSINEKGAVVSVGLTKSSGHFLLDDRARSTVQRWTFKPARLNGKPIATQVDVPVRFRLDR
ncbi:MAG TPA: energy transducer TonB [Terrimicrobiaceae bacterium]